jgi:hypothetical protein
MRQLTTNDVFKMSRILKKINIDLDINGTDEEVGIKLLMEVAENAYLAQNEINEFFGDLVGMTGEEFGNLPLKESMAIMNEFKKLDGINDFFTLVGQSTN